MCGYTAGRTIARSTFDAAPPAAPNIGRSLRAIAVLEFRAEMPASVRSLPVVGAGSAESSDRTKGLLRLTMACNERCPFCNVPFEDYEVVTPPAEEIAAQLDAFIASGERTLTISGGEPTLYRKRLVALIADARARGVPFVELQTNAVLIDSAYAAELRAAGLTSAFVSLLSDVPALHDELAGLPGAFDPCLRGIDALLDHDVRVVLNPVTARQTQARVADYVRFVADRLPRVESISLSAVQPHGRARTNLELLPDYAELGRSVREARRVASERGLRLLNPYCGLPLCIGWDDDDGRARSVEAIEAIEARGATFGALPGIENQGDKEHGVPCLDCALRTRCGGAWRAYWTHRGGSGIAAPLARREPWDDASDAQHVERAWTGGTITTDAPTVWLVIDRLREGDATRIRASGATDLALDVRASDVDALLVRELAALHALDRERPPQGRIRVVSRVVADRPPSAVHRALHRLGEVGVEAVRLVPRDASARWSTLRDVLALDLPSVAVHVERR
jgi:MoaA/NifB/PqqE/SkfB family radical SAM enzyme